jgi:nucleoside-diphosphate-sugar epimerase
MLKLVEGRGANVSSGLSAADFTRLAANGFGEPQNAYVHSMAYFRDQIYAGTSRHSMALLKLFPPLAPPAMDPWPVKVPGSVEDLDMRGQIWRCQVKDGKFEKIHVSPEIKGKNGKKVPRDLGYRGMAVFQGRSDREPALYVASISTVLRGTAAHILRSLDGVNFEVVSEPGLGNPNISTFRALAVFDHHLFAPPAGEGVTFNSNKASVIMRCADPLKKKWEPACEPGFGDPTNYGIFEMVVFNEHLYAGTFNHFHGYQIWKTPATGSKPCRWTKVIAGGAYRGSLNEIAMSLCVHNGALYVGSAIQNGGFDRYNFVGPAAGEVIRLYPDDSWELLVGTPRQTPEGMKYPLSGLGPGFDNVFAGYIWRMTVHDGWLYTSTFDWSVFLPYAGRPSRTAKRMMHGLGVDQIVKTGGGFDLWRTQDGINWIPVTQNGMGNPYNYGARTLVSTPRGLFVGTANPFGPEVAAKISTGAVYIPNPDGGAEVWLGRPAGQHQLEGRELKELMNGRGAVDTIVIRQGRGAANAVAKSRKGKAAAASKKAAKKSAKKSAAKTPRVLLTGAGGFIGSHVLDQLLEQEERVRVFDLPGAVKNVKQPERVEIVAGNLTDEASLGQAVRGIETVYHLAALLPGSSETDLRSINVKGTENLLRACGEAGTVRRFVFTSSVAVYAGAFQPDEWPLHENSPQGLARPENLRNYGRSKMAGENLVRQYAKEFGFEYVILRPATCYGIGSKYAEDLVQSALASPMLNHGRASGMTLQLVHVKDLAEVIARAASRAEATNEIFNVAGTEAYTYGNIVALIRRLAGTTDGSMLLPDRSRIWQRYRFAYDVTKAQRQLDFKPRVAMQEGMAELLAARDGQKRVKPRAPHEGVQHSPFNRMARRGFRRRFPNRFR